MRRAALTAMAVLIASNASAECPTNTVDMGYSSSPTDPLQVVAQCPCISWAPSTGPVDHYHFYVDDVMRGSPTQNSMEFCLAQVSKVSAIVVVGHSTNLSGGSSPVSDPLFIEFVPRDTTEVCMEYKPAQCLSPNGTIVVPCP